MVQPRCKCSRPEDRAFLSEDLSDKLRDRCYGRRAQRRWRDRRGEPSEQDKRAEKARKVAKVGKMDRVEIGDGVVLKARGALFTKRAKQRVSRGRTIVKKRLDRYLERVLGVKPKPKPKPLPWVGQLYSKGNRGFRG